MAPATKDTKQKTRRSRKARTDVSSSSDSSSSDSDSSASTQEPTKPTTSKPTKQQSAAASNPTPDSDSATPPPALPAKTSAKDPEQIFQDFYLKQATKEFSEGLDKLRNAGDWRGQGSLELLIGALKQGGANFSVEERRRVGGAGEGKE